MRGAALPPVKVTNGHHLRIAMARAVSEIQLYGKNTATLPATVAQMQDFVDAVSDELVLIKAYPASIVASASDVALSLASDQTEQIVVTATSLAGPTSNVASVSSYTSSNVAVATVSATGLVTAVGVGSCTVTAQFQNKTSNALAFTVAS